MLLRADELTPKHTHVTANRAEMVKLYALSVFYKAPTEARLLKTAYDLQSFSFFQRGSVQEFIR